ncbi:MAG: hypothetical protein PHO36_06425 [Parabacteroides sp.]|nr:hypothetical protein [Parabacteroides sp.]
MGAMLASAFSIFSLRADTYGPQNTTASLALKVPGNNATEYPLTFSSLSNSNFTYQLTAAKPLPVTIFQKVTEKGALKELTVYITATEEVYLHYGQQLKTGFRHDDCLFYLPGFWYRRNLRSPKEAPSFHTSDSWTVREDRLSAPLTGIYDEKSGKSFTVARKDAFTHEALTPHKEGDVVISGKTSLGFTGFENKEGVANLSFGFPYQETPKTYIRKLTLAPSVRAFQHMEKGETIILTWEIQENQSADYSSFVQRMWEYAFDAFKPQPVATDYTTDRMKEVISNYFTESFVGDKPLVYTSGVHLPTANCTPVGIAEVGFVGRVLLNAFNALEYGEQQKRADLPAQSSRIFESYLANGFTAAGFFKEFVDFKTGFEEPVHSIRRQSEGVYAMLHYLQYEKEQGRKHPQWDKKMKHMLDMFLRLQQADGSFPRKFNDDFTTVDKSGGSTPSATLPLVMGYKYFNDKRYLDGAKRTAAYLEKELISKADYFSSTLDANCEDKEASLYAATATYYLALVSKGQEKEHYASLTKKAAYFALSWYYVWDVPFARGQMLGDLGMKTRGWGNVSVENNHIDVFIFEFASVLNWLSTQYNEPRFAGFAEVISSSMKQLLPYEGHLCGVAAKGYYPEVVQHTQWDYGKNGKGFYNDIFAPGWTVASLWELYTPGRAERFLR